jgi:potassium efflux system protein
MLCRFERRGISMVLMGLMLATAVCATAQEADTAGPSPTPKPAEVKTAASEEMSLDQLRARRSAVEGSQDLGESVKKSVLGLLDQAIRFREQVDRLNRETEEIVQKVKAAPERLKAIETELKVPIPPVDSVEAEASRIKTDELEQRLRQEEAELANAKTTLSGWIAQVDKEKNRAQQLREDIVKAKQRLDQLRQELRAPVPPDEPAPVTEAKGTSLLAEQTKCQTEIRSYEQQLVGEDVLVSLVSAERDLASRQVAWREALTKAWQSQAQKRRQEEAMQARKEAEEAKQQASTLPPAIQEQFDMNVKLGEELEKLAVEEAALTKKLERKQAQLRELEEEFALARERVETTVLTEAIGLALRAQRQSLPSLSNYRRDSARRQLRMSEIREAQFDVDRKRRDLADIDAEAERVIQSLGSFSDTDLSVRRNEVGKLLTDRRDLLEKLQAGYRRHFKNLENIEFTEQQIITRANDYAELLDRHLLWIRSSKIISHVGPSNVVVALKWLMNPTSWWQMVLDMKVSFERSPAVWVLGLLLGLILTAGRGRARQDLAHVAKKVGQVPKDSFSLTIRALLMTACLAAGWPLLMAFVGRQLLVLPMANDFTRAASKGLSAAALMLATIGFVYHMCREDGLAQIHFRWSEAARLTLRRNLLWLLPLLVPLGFLFAAVETENTVAYRDSLGRLAFIAAMVAVSIFTVRVLRFSGGIVSRLLRRHPEGWLVRLRYIWYPLAVGVPLVLALLAAMGYYYTALAFEARVEATVWLVIGLIVVNALFLRWLFIARRRIAFEEAKRKREEARAQKTDKQSTDKGVDGQQIVMEEPEFGLARMDEQTRALLRAVVFFSALIGLWAIWAPVLPALSVMEDIHLWSYRAEVDGVAKTVPISLANLVMTIVVVVITIVAARNLPGVLQITVFNRLSIDSGARYAFGALCRYAIIAIGIILAFTRIGIRWSSLQWLVAALGVGLGFGLQEIVANFVCGLIVLFERPYRVGDVVTVGDTSGVVTRIRIRATTITNWDRQELIVPNKDFVTGKLINWSLSDPITRVVIPVGIAYGSDTALAEKLLLKVARENSVVLDQPEPSALFLGFGDNSLNFELRVFVSGVERLFPVKHQLHQVINREFQEAGITIAFPQRDVHLDTTGPVEVRLVSEQAPSQQPIRAVDGTK